MKKRFNFWCVTAVLLLAGVAGIFYFRSIPQPAASPVHYSYYSQSHFYDQAYASAPHSAAGRPAAEPRALLVNHHLLAANFIAESFNAAATTAPLTVLLVSPNHFSAGQAGVITSAEAWQTPYGLLEPESRLVSQLSSNGLASVEETSFNQEHGVSGIVAFIKRSLPNARVVPLIFNDRLPLASAKSLADRVSALLPDNTLIVGSFDFSHYLTSRAADFHDLSSLSVIQNFDLEKINNLDVDSRPGLEFFLALLKDGGAENFTQLEHSNSAKLVHQDILETTSYIDGYFLAGTPAATSSANTLLSLPGISGWPGIGRYINASSPVYALAYLERLFYGQGQTLAFARGLDAAASSRFQQLGITLLSSGQVVQLGRHKAALVDCPAEKNNPQQAISAGADVVICQGAAKNKLGLYGNKLVIYISGNLLDSSSFGKIGTSMAVGLADLNNQTQVILLPIGLSGGQVKLLTAAENDTVLADVAKNSLISESIKDQIKLGVITISNFK